MKLIQDIFGSLAGADVSSRKAQALGAGAVAVFAAPDLAWPITLLVTGYIFGRAVHDAALAGK